jgi:hypothetical protein
MLFGSVLFAVLGLVLTVLDVVIVRWMIRRYDWELLVASFL